MSEQCCEIGQCYEFYSEVLTLETVRKQKNHSLQCNEFDILLLWP